MCQPTDVPLFMADSCVQARGSVDGEDSRHYQELYTHLQKEYTELQRSHQLLQTRLQPGPGTDIQREERNWAGLRTRLMVSETMVADLKRLLKAEGKEEQDELGQKMVEEKQALIQVYMRVPHNYDCYSFVTVEPWSQ